MNLIGKDGLIFNFEYLNSIYIYLLQRLILKLFDLSYCVYRRKHGEFLPSPNWEHRDRICETLERQDMFKRRRQIHLPEFYVGKASCISFYLKDKMAIL